MKVIIVGGATACPGKCGDAPTLAAQDVPAESNPESKSEHADLTVFAPLALICHRMVQLRPGRLWPRDAKIPSALSQALP